MTFITGDIVKLTERAAAGRMFTYHGSPSKIDWVNRRGVTKRVTASGVYVVWSGCVYEERMDHGHVELAEKRNERTGSDRQGSGLQATDQHGVLGVVHQAGQALACPAHRLGQGNGERGKARGRSRQARSRSDQG